ncbi:MAG: hemolysin III family protein [Bacilli bacterium]
MSLKKIVIPNYKLSQELWNSISHGIGAIFGIVATVLMLLKICVWGYEGINTTEKVFRIVACSIYGFSMILCFTVSCIYHGLAKNSGKKVFRVIDHDTVFLLIAGTYTAYTLITLRNETLWGVIPYSGWIMFGIVMVCVIIGITFNSIDMNKFKKLSMVLYIVVGWVIVCGAYELYFLLTPAGFWFLFGGGIAYTIGAILYAIGSKKSKWWHTVFHFFILIGTVLQFISIYVYALN